MHIHDLLRGEGPKFSFEFFPPKSQSATQSLLDAISELKSYSPSFVSITYGAGGTTRNLTQEWVERVGMEHGLNVIPHLTCVGHSEQEIDRILQHYTQAGIGNILALRGDLPARSTQHSQRAGAFPHAIDLVKAIRRFSERNGHPHPKGFGIGIAGFPEGHPGTPNRLLEMDRLKEKVDAGADYICTQMFFGNRDFHDFRARCELAGIHVPILAGILPVNSISGLHRMAELAGGCRFPAKLLKALQRPGNNPEAVRQVGIHYATEQCADLLHHNVTGIQLYTLNQSSAACEILKNLGLKGSPAKQRAALTLT